MTLEQFKALEPCKSGYDYALRFPTIKEAWLNCRSIRDMLWFANATTKRTDLIVIFAEECVRRALTYAAAAVYSAAAAAAVYSSDAAIAAADVAYAAVDAADVAYADVADADVAEREIQRDRIYELFTNLIFPE